MRFLIADDHAIVRKGLAEMLQDEFNCATVIEVSNSTEALEQIRNNQWDLILLDISMPGRNGIETLKQIRSDGIKTPVLMLSMHSEGQYAVRVLKAGASGFVNKESATEELLVAVHKILSGKKYITASIAEKLADFLNGDDGKPVHEMLSDREMQVLQRIAAGKTITTIAVEVSLSINTISTYRKRILVKLGLENNAELTRFALDNNLA